MSFPQSLRRFPSPALLLAPAMVLLAACTAPPMDEQDAVTAQAQQDAQAAAAPVDDAGKATEAPPIGNCDATQVQSLVGQPWSEDLSGQAQQDATAREVRVLKPNEATTMEFIGERLNIELDAEGTVTGVRCG